MAGEEELELPMAVEEEEEEQGHPTEEEAVAAEERELLHLKLPLALPEQPLVYCFHDQLLLPRAPVC